MNEERKTHKAAVPRDSEPIRELRALKNEARERGDEETAQRIYAVIHQLLMISK